MNYWLGRGGQKLGPYSLDTLQRMAAEGSAVASDLVWHEGMTAWAPLFQEVPMPGAQDPPPPQPPGPTFGWTQPPSPANPFAPGPSYLVPPDFHWALVLLLGIVTFGIFLIVWFFVEANFVRKIDRSSNAILLGALGYAASFASGFIQGLSPFIGDASVGNGFALLLKFGGYVLVIIAIFSMMSSLEKYYNDTEPIGLTLSGVMTFFFGLFYFQHHFSRIAKWKKTGVLRPQ